MRRRPSGFTEKALVPLPTSGIPPLTARYSMSPFTPKEVCRFFALVAIVGVVIVAALWFLFFSAGHQQIHVRPHPASAFIATGQPVPTASSEAARQIYNRD
jgi:hypothetical protein